MEHHDRPGERAAPTFVAIRGFAGAPRWAEVSRSVIPLLVRRRPPAAHGACVSVELDPGLPVGVAIDLGAAFLYVSAAMLAAWRIEIGDLVRRSIGNLRERARQVGPEGVQRARVGLVPLSMLQRPDGWASSLLLAPDLLPRWFGDQPRVLVAPARNLLVGMPPTTDRRLIRFLAAELAAAMPEALAVPPLRWSAGRLQRVEADEVESGIDGLATRGAERPPTRWPPASQGARTTWYRPPPARSVR